MTDMADADAIEAIKQVKYRYMRALDTKHWDDFADTLTEDIIGAYGSSLGEEHHFTNRTELVEFMRKSMPAGVLTEHRVTHPEITVNGDEAEAIWYLQDRVIVPEYNFMLMGPGSTATAIARRPTVGRSARPDTTAPTRSRSRRRT